MEGYEFSERGKFLGGLKCNELLKKGTKKKLNYYLYNAILICLVLVLFFGIGVYNIVDWGHLSKIFISLTAFLKISNVSQERDYVNVRLCLRRTVNMEVL